MCNWRTVESNPIKSINVLYGHNLILSVNPRVQLPIVHVNLPMLCAYPAGE